TRQHNFISVRDGEDVTLPCNIVRNDQDEYKSPAVELINLGKIGEKAQSKSSRLSVTENCSLVVKKVTVDDSGRYTCRQFNKSGQQQGQDASVHLFVINSEYLQHHNVFNLNCLIVIINIKIVLITVIKFILLFFFLSTVHEHKDDDNKVTLSFIQDCLPPQLNQLSKYTFVICIIACFFCLFVF
uniref:Ig-like domain-containing protein n=1 Tax=Anabas testudineus TaxID=64144 RepID=A0AAQ6IHT6_ANATE